MSKPQFLSPRLESLFKSGEEKLRARHLSDREELSQLKRRIENEALQQKPHTFSPNVKWNVIRERREATMQNTPEKRSNDETKKLTRSEREKLERDRRYEEMELKNCTFKPNLDWKKRNNNPNTSALSSSCENNSVEERRPVNESENTSVEETKPIVEKTPKLVSDENVSEGTGKDARTKTVIHRNVVLSENDPKSPLWKKKFREIGQKKELEEELVAQGTLPSPKATDLSIPPPPTDSPPPTEY